MPPINVFAMVFWCLVGAHAVSHDASCGDCMEHNEENVLVQLVNLQQNMDTEGSTVCTGGNSGSSDQQILIQLDTFQNVFTVDSTATSPECQCVGSPTAGSIPGYLGVSVSPLADVTGVSFISITSPNGTEVKVTPVRFGNLLLAETVAFNGFQGVGNWTIKLLDASSNLSNQKGSRVLLDFGLLACSQVWPVPDCVGNAARGQGLVVDNLSLVGTTLSTSPTLLQFDVVASSSCCVVADSDYSGIALELEFSRPPSPNGTVTADGLSPSGSAFTFTGGFMDGKFLGDTVTILGGDANSAKVAPGFARTPAAGRWMLKVSTDGDAAVINSSFLNPRLSLKVAPCHSMPSV